MIVNTKRRKRGTQELPSAKPSGQAQAFRPSQSGVRNAATSAHKQQVDALWGEFAAAELVSAGSSSTWGACPSGSTSSKSSLPRPTRAAAGVPPQRVLASSKLSAQEADALWGEFAAAEVASAERSSTWAACPSGSTSSKSGVPKPTRAEAQPLQPRLQQRKATPVSSPAPSSDASTGVRARKRKAAEDSETVPLECKRHTQSSPSSQVVDLTGATSKAGPPKPPSGPTTGKSALQASHPSRPAAVGKKPCQMQWRVRNLSCEYATMLADPSLSIATRARDNALHAVQACEREVNELRLELQAFGASSPSSAPSLELASTQWGEAQRRVDEIRARIEQLPPGPDLLEATAELREAHQDAAAADKAYQHVQRAVMHGHRSEQLANLLQNNIQRLAVFRAKAAELSIPVAQLENARAPLEQEFAEAERQKEELPPLVLYVCPLPELKQALRRKDADLRFGCLANMIRTEWSLSLARDGQRSEGSRAYGMLSPHALIAAFNASPELANDVANPVILALEAYAPPGIDDGAATECPKTRYILARSEAVAAMREQVAQVPAVPHSLELLRASLGLVPDMWLHKMVLQACQQAFLLRSCQAPSGLQGQLRPYQARGYQWLVGNAENGFGCILADDMGLGKTLQSIALLLHLHATGRIGCHRRVCPGSPAGSRPLPALVVAPYSVLRCWELELKRWAPTLQCYVYHGSNRRLPSLPRTVPNTNEEIDSKDPSPDVLLTTYGTLQKDCYKMTGLDSSSSSDSSERFGCIILDESQTIKNASSLTSKAVKLVAVANGGSCFRLALSGTPVENRLSEMHSLFDFLNPGFLGTKAEFTANFVKPIEKIASSSKAITKRASDGKEEAIRKLRVAIGPFLLRRCKTDSEIAPELPDKVELLHVVQLGSAQRRLYSAVADEALQKVVDRGGDTVVDSAGAEIAGDEDIHDEDVVTDGAQPEPGRPRRPVARVLSMLHGLQQVCNHPAALPLTRWPAKLQAQHGCPDLSGSNHQASGKTSRLLELLEEILDPPREKVLIFTQYRATLEFIALLVERKFPGVRSQRFHGGLNREERDAATREFSQDPATAVMVLTLQAGGVGLTLTAASHVIHFDRCWNPAKEMQATDRAHRLGQRRTVVVHRLVTAETFEERLATVVSQKISLASSVITVNAAQILTEYSDMQLRQLFLLGGGAGTTMKSG